MKIALITDSHWGCRNDNSAFMDYFQKFYENIFFPYLEQHDIKTIVHLGDVVDRRKFISYVTLRRMKEHFFDECEKRNIDLHIIIGNHDTYFKNTNEINSMKELFGDSHVSYYWKPETVMFDGYPILLMPWINAQNWNDAIEAINDTVAPVCLGHLDITGAFMDRGNKNVHGMSAKYFDKFELVCSGHFHHRNKISNIQYLGCPYEITWIDYQDPKGFHVYDTETRDLEHIRNPYSMFHKIFYSDEGKSVDDLLGFDFDQYRDTYVKVVKLNCDNPYWFDLFMDKLMKVNPINIQVVDDNLNLNLESAEELVDEAEDTLTIMSKYINQMPENVPKQKLDSLMRSLYNEAMSLGL